MSLSTEIRVDGIQRTARRRAVLHGDAAAAAAGPLRAFGSRHTCSKGVFSEQDRSEKCFTPVAASDGRYGFADLTFAGVQ